MVEDANGPDTGRGEEAVTARENFQKKDQELIDQELTDKEFRELVNAHLMADVYLMMRLCDSADPAMACKKIAIICRVILEMPAYGQRGD